MTKFERNPNVECRNPGLRVSSLFRISTLGFRVFIRQYVIFFLATHYRAAQGQSKMAHQALAGKSIVVIGGTTGLGFSSARAFIENGARVLVVGRNAESGRAAQKKLGSCARAMSADAIDPITAVRAIEMATRQFGRFDGLYHVAGGSGRSLGDGPLHELTDEGWRGTVDLNLSSMVFSNRAAVRQ